MRCPVCNADLYDLDKICIYCGHCFVGFRKPEGRFSTLECQDPEYVSGFGYLKDGNPELAFDAWIKYLENADSEHASMLYDDLLRVLAAFLVEEAYLDDADYLSEIPGLCSGFARLIKDRSFARDLCKSLSEYPAEDMDIYSAAFAMAERVSDEYAGYLKSMEDLRVHIDGMMPILEDFKSRSAETYGEDDYDIESYEEFFHDLAGRLYGPPPEPYEEIEYAEAKDAWRRFRSAILGKDKKRKRYEDAVSDYVGSLRSE